MSKKYKYIMNDNQCVNIKINIFINKKQTGKNKYKISDLKRLTDEIK